MRTCLVAALFLACGAHTSAPTSVVVPPAASAAPVAPAVSVQSPEPIAIDVNFENRVHLVGYRFDPAVAPPGTLVKITLVWKCDDWLDQGWQLFTHVQDDASGKTANLAGQPRPSPWQWQPGGVYVDEQEYTVPVNAGADNTVYAGLWKGDARLRVIAGPQDGDNRAVVGKIKTK